MSPTSISTAPGCCGPTSRTARPAGDRPNQNRNAPPPGIKETTKMIIVMKTEASEAQVLAIQKHIRELGFKDHLIRGVERNVVAVLGAVYPELLDEFAVLDGVDSVVRISKPFKLASRA